jgi:hypothetical protein
MPSYIDGGAPTLQLTTSLPTPPPEKTSGNGDKMTPLFHRSAIQAAGAASARRITCMNRRLARDSVPSAIVET